MMGEAKVQSRKSKTTAGIIVSDDVSVYVKPARDNKHTFIKNKRDVVKLLTRLHSLFGVPSVLLILDDLVTSINNHFSIN